jgi:hypothetical protein
MRLVFDKQLILYLYLPKLHHIVIEKSFQNHLQINIVHHKKIVYIDRKRPYDHGWVKMMAGGLI